VTPLVARFMAFLGSALPCRGRSTSPTTEQLARDVPERSEDEARPVTGAVHAGSNRRDSFAGAAGAGDRGGSTGFFRALEALWLYLSRRWKTHAVSDGRKTGTGALPVIGRAIQGKLPLHRYGVTLEPGSDIGKEPRPYFARSGATSEVCPTYMAERRAK
jgi:hypothetical protein